MCSARLVTLTGTGGTGKTRLALQVARDVADGFVDGVAFADLGPVRDPALLATAVARALGLTPASAEAAEAHLAGALADRELLLVADNLEHLLDETPLLARVLPPPRHCGCWRPAVSRCACTGSTLCMFPAAKPGC